MANINRKWRGAVQPAAVSPSGNENKRWRGAIEPVGVVPSPGAPSGSGRTGPGLTYGKFGKLGA